MLISPITQAVDLSRVGVSNNSSLGSMFPGTYGNRPPYTAPDLACSSCMSTLTEDALCAECGREFEP